MKVLIIPEDKKEMTKSHALAAHLASEGHKVAVTTKDDLTLDRLERKLELMK